MADLVEMVALVAMIGAEAVVEAGTLVEGAAPEEEAAGRDDISHLYVCDPTNLRDKRPWAKKDKQWLL